MSKDTTGIHAKYTVTRNDGKDGPGQKHHGCSYFVLDVDHDPHAHVALLAYAESCESESPELAKGLRKWVGITALAQLKAASPPACTQCNDTGLERCYACLGEYDEHCAECDGKGCEDCEYMGHFPCGECNEGKVPCRQCKADKKE